MHHEQTKRDKEVSAALRFAISQDQKQEVKLLHKTGHTEYHVTLQDGTNFVADSVIYNEQKNEITFVLKKRIRVKVTREDINPVKPGETFFGPGNPFNIVPEIIGGTFVFVQTCGQKSVEASIQAAEKVFDFLSGIFLATEDYFDYLLDYIFDGEALQEIIFDCCDFWELVESQEFGSLDIISAMGLILFTVFRVQLIV